MCPFTTHGVSAGTAARNEEATAAVAGKQLVRQRTRAVAASS